MLMHPIFMLELVEQHRRELVAEADRERLLARVLRARRSRREREAGAARGQHPTTTAAPAR
ncbi:hypothetical protein [Actinoplanes sp. NPDC020271]|uniref:hypothetical protein n=1 Tax=Actinoplanes sp. NPDC020271 TaxID=3363896 RepID=UPI0037A90D4E